MIKVILKIHIPKISQVSSLVFSAFFIIETNATEDSDDEQKSFEKDTGPPLGIENRDITNDNDVGKTITVERMERGRVSYPLHPLCDKCGEHIIM